MCVKSFEIFGEKLKNSRNGELLHEISQFHRHFELNLDGVICNLPILLLSCTIFIGSSTLRHMKPPSDFSLNFNWHQTRLIEEHEACEAPEQLYRTGQSKQKTRTVKNWIKPKKIHLIGEIFRNETANYPEK